ncbi:SWI/SNF-related matrix-associated actin-dependent regulator of chromatin subfamily E member 1-like [Clytia hemisphaerica]|uniref:HMG box domain-containing protein n=1 Tax=Clytia hemisphaerica TaxID=252671 RepID=A0A7M5WVY4_9CNID
MNFGPRGGFPGASNASGGRFRNAYQQNGAPNMGQPRGHRPPGPYNTEQIKIPKPPKQPDKPLPAYMRYSRKVWEKVKAGHPEMKMWDIGKLIGEQWRNLPEDERQGFFAEYEVEKAEYQDAMKAYHSSAPYRDWLKSKEKAQAAIQEQQMMEKMIGQQMPKEEPRFQLQQVEDEDDEADFAVKHIATARFQRNHRLITEIFSEAAVPDAKSIVTRPRLENLKRQVQSLMQHQRKLENEIEEMEGKFEAKRKKILDNSESFKVKIEELSKPPPPLPSPKPDDEAKKGANEENTEENKEQTPQEGEEKMEIDQTEKETITNMADEAVTSPTVENLSNVLSSNNASDEKESIPATESGSKQADAAKDVTAVIETDEKETPNTGTPDEAEAKANA